MKYDLFISYSRKDFDEVNAFLRTLCEQIPTLTYWFDITGIESGDEFEEKIITAINNSSYVLFALSDNSINSQWTKDEVMYAKNTGKKIIPVLLKGATLKNGWFLFKFGRVDCIDSTNPVQVNKLINNLSVWISKNNPNSKASLSVETPNNEEGEVVLSNQECLVREEKRPSQNKFDRNVTVERYVSKLKQLLWSQFQIILSLNNNKERFEYCVNSIVRVLKLKKVWFALLIALVLFKIWDYRYLVSDVSFYQFVTPARKGNVLAHDGRLLTDSEPVYDIYLDCKIRIDTTARYENLKEEAKFLFETMFNKSQRKDFETGRPKISKESDSIWRDEAQKLSEALSSLLCEKTSKEYYDAFCYARYNERSNRNVLIGKNVEQIIRDTIVRMPLLRRGRIGGGLIVEKHYNRKYPYGDLALRTLGYSNSIAKVGVEGAFDSIMRGQDGKKIVKKINVLGIESQKEVFQKERIDGADIRTTLAIPMQEIADRVLRINVSKDSMVYGGAVTVMDVKTGAIKVMSNIVKPQRDATRPPGEYYNLAIGYAFEPGSVLGGVALASYINDWNDLDINVLAKSIDSVAWPKYAIKKISNLENASSPEEYEFCHRQIVKGENESNSILDGVCQSNPYTLAGLALCNYGYLPSYLDFLNNLYLFEDINFDIEGLREPMIAPLPLTDDYNYFLATLGCGYGVCMTQLHILAFYNMIANDGVKVNPYLVESYENSKQYTFEHQSIGKSSLLKKESTDILKSVMRRAVVDGYSGLSGKAKEDLAGMAGHGIYYSDGEYMAADGKQRWNSTFVGYFPADNPKYSIICTIVTYKTKGTYPGDQLPAKIVSEIYESMRPQ